MISKRSLWCDEFIAISLAKLNSSDMVRWIIERDAHPPFFYYIYHFILKFTQSEFGLRFLPAVFGGGSIIIFYFLLRNFFNKEKIVLPLTLFVLSPAAILWSQMIKSYSMLTFFSLVSLYSFLSLLKENRFKFVFFWSFSTILSVYLHHYGGIILLSQVIILFLSKKKDQLKPFILPVLVIALFSVPYLGIFLLPQLNYVKGAYHTITNPFLRLGYTFFYFTFGETLSPLNLIFVVPGGLLFVFFFLKGVFKKKKEVLENFSIISLGISIILYFTVKATIPQNLILLQPLFFILISSGVNMERKVLQKKVFSFLLPLFLLPPIYFYYKGDSLEYHDVSKLTPYREVSKMIQEEEREGEAVLFTEKRERRFTDFFPKYSPWDWYYKGTSTMFEVNPSNMRDLDEELLKIKNKYNSYWLLLDYGFVEPEWNEKVKDFLLNKKSVKIKEEMFVKNFSFLDFLKNREKKEYHFLWVYHIERETNE
ncbi:glycosyltransferase family 39 protein [bacterium]|nr:glycosyltransferase family 39 protein [bacterium]